MDSPLDISGEVEWPRHLRAHEAEPGLEMSSDEWGWPWGAMQWTATFRTSVAPGGSQATNIEVQHARTFQVGQKWVQLPLLPIWNGLVANAVVYAVICGVLWFGPRAVRRGMRRRRGQCAACGYSLREFTGERCPECGGVVEERAAG